MLTQCVLASAGFLINPRQPQSCGRGFGLWDPLAHGVALNEVFSLSLPKDRGGPCLGTGVSFVNFTVPRHGR